MEDKDEDKNKKDKNNEKDKDIDGDKKECKEGKEEEEEDAEDVEDAEGEEEEDKDKDSNNEEEKAASNPKWAPMRKNICDKCFSTTPPKFHSTCLSNLQYQPRMTKSKRNISCCAPKIEICEMHIFVQRGLNQRLPVDRQYCERGTVPLSLLDRVHFKILRFINNKRMLARSYQIYVGTQYSRSN